LLRSLLLHHSLPTI